jgi:hypothetical protein
LVYAAAVPAVPPALLLAALLALIGTQVASLIAPRRPPYAVRLAISAIAVLGGELLGMTGRGWLAVGDLHPVLDAALIAAGQWAVTWWWAHRRRPA